MQHQSLSMLHTNFPDLIILVHRYAEESGDLLGELKVSDLLVTSLNSKGVGTTSVCFEIPL